MRRTRVRGRRRKVKKGRLFLLFLIFILAPTLTVMGVVNFVSNGNGEDGDTMTAMAYNNTFWGSRRAGENTSDDDPIDKIVESLEEYEIVFTYSTYRFVHTFAEFLDYVCEDDLTLNFDRRKISDALRDMDNQIRSTISSIDRDVVIDETMAILLGEREDNVVVLTMEWTRSPHLAHQDILGSFYTYFNSGEVGRNGNIRRAADLINNMTLLPGQDFSMNQSIGPVALDNGYYIALVIANGEFVEGIGGGVCQVATTLYMAVLHAELEILQRRAHSRLVGYVPPAFDSVLATPYLDLRFRNDQATPVTIETIFDYRNNRLTVNILGQETRPEGRTIYFESVHAAENDTYVSYHLYKLVNDNGVFTRIRINISTYRVDQEGAMTYYEAISGDSDDDD